MRMRTLGGTGIKVSPYCLGAMMFGAWGNPDHEESIRIIHAALDGGVNFVDTADVYSAGESEEIVGKALKGRRDDVVLATKAHSPMGQDPNMRGNSRRWIVREVENSLRRLQTDYIDLYQMHRPDPDTDIDETLSALSDLVRGGKVRAIGSSTFPADQIVEAQWAAAHQVGQRGQGLVDIGVGIRAVHLVQVDVVGLQAAQAVLHLADEPAARVAAHVGVLAHLAVRLGGQHHAVAAPAQGLADDLLRLPRRVHVRGVDEVDAAVERGVDDPDALLVFGVAPRAEHHRAEAVRADLDPGSAERPHPHPSCLLGVP